jgi:glycine/D-amino acid oxidase-like deaminating enzyme
LLFRDIETSNNWLGRLSDPALEGYIGDEFELNAYQQTFGSSVVSGVEFQQSGRCDLPTFINSWRDFLTKKGIEILQERFDYDQLELGESKVRYKNLTAGQIIFCEGHAGADNPFFANLDFQAAKGEMLLVKIANYPFNDKMPKDGIFIVHIKGDLYWVGSSYNRDFQHNKPSKEEYINLTKELSEMLKIPFEVVDHLAEIRPTVRDRKPYLGYHPQQKNLLIFNGLGAKGCSLGPYFAAHFADWLNNETDLDREVDISRLKSLRK